MEPIPDVAGERRGSRMPVVWGVVTAVVVVFGGFAPDWSTLLSLAGDREGLILDVALYTFPLTLAFTVNTLIFLAMARSGQNPSPPAMLGVAAFVFWACGQLAGWLGVGILPDQKAFTLGGGLSGVFLGALRAYFNTYGWPLMVCALAIGVAAAMQVETWFLRRAPQT